MWAVEPRYPFEIFDRFKRRWRLARWVTTIECMGWNYQPFRIAGPAEPTPGGDWDATGSSRLMMGGAKREGRGRRGAGSHRG